eukprot:895396_1
MARPQCKETANTNLYVKNVPSYYREKHLAKLFAPFGKIIECRILFYPDKGYFTPLMSKGIGFVRMDTKQNAIQALQALNQYIIDNKLPALFVKFAERRSRGYARNSCSYCEKTFIHQNDLIYHERMHSGEKPCYHVWPWFGED